MNEMELKGHIEDKKRIYEEAVITSRKALERAEAAEKVAMVAKAHARKMAERQNEALKLLREVA